MGDFLYAVAIVVAGGAILAGFTFAARWLSTEDNRVKVKQRACRHDWKKIDVGIGSSVIFVTGYDEECRKCGARK